MCSDEYKGAFDEKSVLEPQDEDGHSGTEFAGVVEWTDERIRIGVRIKKKKSGILKNMGLVVIGFTAGVLITEMVPSDSGKWGLFKAVVELLAEIVK